MSRRLNLVLHAGANHQTLTEVQAIPTPQPEGKWYPIPHTAIIEEAERAIDAAGLHIVVQEHALTKDGARYFGLMQVENGRGSTDYGLVVGLRNTHDRSFGAGLVVGHGVFVCDNLAFGGEIKITRKHTSNILRDLPGLMSAAIGRIGDLRRTQEKRIEAYKGYELSAMQTHDLLIRGMDARVYPSNAIGKVLAEWRNPSHEEFKEMPQTAWRFLNAVTEVRKGGNLFLLPKTTQALHGILDSAVGIVTASSTIKESLVADGATDFDIEVETPPPFVPLNE